MSFCFSDKIKLQRVKRSTFPKSLACLQSRLHKYQKWIETKTLTVNSRKGIRITSFGLNVTSDPIFSNGDKLKPSPLGKTSSEMIFFLFSTIYKHIMLIKIAQCKDRLDF